jgi:hypothetical protein
LMGRKLQSSLSFRPINMACALNRDGRPEFVPSL